MEGQFMAADGLEIPAATRTIHVVATTGVEPGFFKTCHCIHPACVMSVISTSLKSREKYDSFSRGVTAWGEQQGL